MPFHEVGFTGGSDEHDTPVGFFAPIAECLDGFDVDPCASSTSDLADVNYTKQDDGLSKEWFGDVWLNPPYSDAETWIEEAETRYNHGQVDRVVALTFARTDTKYFHNHAPQAEYLCFVEGRLQFGDSNKDAPAPSLVLMWGDVPESLLAALRRGPGRARGGLVVRLDGVDGRVEQ